jgi:dihydropyrimidinase
MSENPAKIFGLWPKKGALQVNSDADLVLFDPQQAHTITHSSQHTRTGYTLFDGRECLGKPVFSLQRGRVLLDHGEIRQTPGSAQFLPTQAGKVDPTTLR